ncbi:MAG: DUF1553 domain-containing protein [Pirellulaceae bacterium]|nr:DUF1553 domain-containing protein [Pirellulaceae bacterium]
MRWLPLVFPLVALVPITVLGGEPDFDREVAPILAGRCLDCHSGTGPKGNLDLSTAKAALAGGDSGPAIVPGKPAKSPLWERIEANEMPPKHPLPAAERKVLREWLAAGARWGTDPIDPFRFTSVARAGYDWWSLAPLAKVASPTIANPRSAIRNPIDAFIQAKLAERGLAPSPPAEPRVLIRRLAFDLTGLPPTPEEVSEFVESCSPSPPRPPHPPKSDEVKGGEGERERAIAKLINRLLESPHHGERWARHWLDVAHFGESDGFEYDRMRPHAWRYRDWVIDALNADMPYDEFARLQIAGDVLRPGDEQAIVATGFLVAGAHDSLLPKGEVMQQIMRQDELEDIVGIVGQTFLGLTVHCARCHDHKFDPIRQSDYFRLASALAGVRRGNRTLPAATPPSELAARQQALRGELAAIETAARTAILKMRESGKNSQPALPQPIARWEFDGNLRDSFGNLHGTAHGRAKVDRGLLVLDGRDAYVSTPPLERELTEKTLEAWVKLSNFDQRGGAAISVQTLDGNVFDALVFGEKEPGRWLAGSDHFRRTQPFAGAPAEAEAKEQFVHVALVYRADGQIAAYRAGLPYGEPYQAAGPIKFAAGKSQVVLGLRHSPAVESKILSGRIERASLYDRALSPAEVAASAGSLDLAITEADLLAQLDEQQRERRTELQAELQRLEESLKTYRDRQCFAVTPQQAPVVHLLARGNVLQPGAAMVPGGIAALGASEPDFALPADAPDADRRAKLAAWIASRRNPLFARTIVNRLWHYHFGRGLIETPNDLGFNGGQPTHRELLDWLAGELIASRWSLKHVHRLIVSSATYQQASHPVTENLAADADNRLFWRYSPRRLEAESVRDAMLVAAGQLNPQRGGPSYHDFRPYSHKNAQYYEPADPIGPEFNRRSIYRMWARGGKNPLLDTFDCPDPSTTIPKRGATTTPLQALSLFNNSFTLRMADNMAERLAKERPGNATRQVIRAFELACGREPTEAERQISIDFVSAHGLAPFCRVLLNTNGFLYVN